MTIERAVWIFGFFALCIGPAAAAQKAALPPSPTLTVQTNLVEVPALVRTRAGAVVFAMDADDFLLTDNGVVQKVTVDSESGSEPLALAIVVETGGAGARHLHSYGRLAEAIENLTPNIEHRMAVISFDSKPELLQAFTPETSKAAYQLANLQPGDNEAAILDAVAFAIAQLREQPSRFRRAILLLSETVDQSSTTSLGDALRLIGTTNTAVYSFGFSSGRDAVKHENSKFNRLTEPGPAHGCFSRNGADAEYSGHYGKQVLDCISDLAPPLRFGTMAYLAAHEGLRRNTSQSIAELTGGMYRPFKNGKELEQDLSVLAKDLPNYYILSFRPTELTPGPHALRLAMKDRPDVNVIYRTGYWLDSGDSASSKTPGR
jgi:VWFA-related protein